MKYFLFILLSLIVFSCKKEITEEKPISVETKSSAELDKLRYEFLNQILSEDVQKNSIEGINMSSLYQISLKKINLPENKLVSNNEEPLPPPGLYLAIRYDSLFLEKDSLFYISESKDLENFKFDKSLIKEKLDYINWEELNNFSIDNRSDFWVNFNKKYPDTCIKTFSVPFFNKEKNICIITYSSSCGPLWGGGFTGIYKKENGKWKMINMLNSWVS